MASIFRKHYEKEEFIYHNVIMPYHPVIKKFCKDKKSSLMLSKACKLNMLNIESLCEQTVAHVGKINQSSVWGEDFDDGTELKVVQTLNVFNRSHKRIVLNNLHRKKNVIRLIVYNNLKSRMDYFIFKLDEIGFDKTSKVRFEKCYNPKTDIYHTIQPYKLNSFEELCKQVQ